MVAGVRCLEAGGSGFTTETQRHRVNQKQKRLNHGKHGKSNYELRIKNYKLEAEATAKAEAEGKFTGY